MPTNFGASKVAGDVILASDVNNLRTAVNDLEDGSAFYVTTGGTATAYTASPSPSWSAYAAGNYLVILVHATNTGAATLAVSGLAAKSIKKVNGTTDLVAGDLQQNHAYLVVYDGTNFLLVGHVGSHNHQSAASGGALDAAAISTGVFPLARLPIALARKSSDQSVSNSTALQDDAALRFSVAANEIWAFEAYVTYTDGSNGVADLKFTFVGPAGSTISWGALLLDGANALVLSSKLGGGDILVAGGATVERQIRVMAMIANGTTAGELKLQWAQNTADAASVTVKANSWVWAIRTT